MMNSLGTRVAECRERLMQDDGLIDRIDGQMRECGMTRLGGLGAAAGHRDLENELNILILKQLP